MALEYTCNLQRVCRRHTYLQECFLLPHDSRDLKNEARAEVSDGSAIPKCGDEHTRARMVGRTLLPAAGSPGPRTKKKTKPQ
ncbi:hypothetical protein FHG87_009240 [Trinorchestia longiramus]|nr:hypothetical protein FHG87_009240 [Trinorchestia longiramus]